MRQRELKRGMCSTPPVMWRDIQKKKNCSLLIYKHNRRKQDPGLLVAAVRCSVQVQRQNVGNVRVHTNTIISDGSGTHALIIKTIFFSKINTKVLDVLSHFETRFSCPLVSIHCFFLHSFRRLEPDYALFTRHKGTVLSTA